MAERMFGKEARHIKDPKVNAALRKVRTLPAIHVCITPDAFDVCTGEAQA
jgi:hypothetical protein